MTDQPDFDSISTDEAALVDGLRRGDADAYEQLVRTYGGRLLQVARRYLSDDEAQDALQEALVSAWKSIDRFDGASKVSTWLHRIVVNACLMRLRKKQTRIEQATEELEPLLPRFLEDGHRADVGPAWGQTPEALLRRTETRELVRQTIQELPDAYRTVILLRDIEGLSGTETAEQLDITANAVKVRLHRARQALREALDRHLRDLEPAA
ncbi:MAG: sigma-70 family RNA polymerase sigma factor [Acidobacteriota bacterium]